MDRGIHRGMFWEPKLTFWLNIWAMDFYMYLSNDLVPKSYDTLEMRGHIVNVLVSSTTDGYLQI